MTDDGFEIPIGGDLSQLNEAIEKVVAAFQSVAASINASFAKANAAMDAATARIRANTSAAIQSSAANAQAGSSMSSAAGKASAFASIAGDLGQAAEGAGAAIHYMSKASRILTGVSLAGHLSRIVTRAGSVRAAFAKIPAAMMAIARNPTLRKVVIGAAAAATAIIAIRAAWRTAAAASRALRNAAAATFSAVISGAHRAASAVRKTMSSIASLPGKLAGALPSVPFAGMIAGVGGVAGALSLAVASVNKAAEMETLETAFAPLIGGTVAAKERIKELSEFAAATPFELPEIAKASRVLEVLTKGALSTGSALTLVGDVASATQQPFDEIAMWIGRLYDGLQSGRPVGEAMMRLQELGAVSGDVRGQIEKMQKAGVSGNEMWLAASNALGRFSGSMNRQSQTWSGKLSTLRDEIGMAMAEFGRPIIDGIKPFLDMAIQKIESMKEEAARFGKMIGDAFMTAYAVIQTGTITEVLSAGIVLAFVKGVNALSSGIRSVIAYFRTALVETMKRAGGSEMIGNLLKALEMLGRAFGAMITQAILLAIDKIPGIDTKKDAKWAGWRADQYMHNAGLYMKDIDPAKAIENMINGGVEIHKMASKNAKKAGSEKLMDEKGPLAKWIDALAIGEKFAQDYKAKRDRAQAEMDANLRKTTSTTSAPFASIAKAIMPAVSSLGRVGGGGAAGGAFQPVVNEQKRTNGILSRFLPYLAGRQGLPVIA